MDEEEVQEEEGGLKIDDDGNAVPEEINDLGLEEELEDPEDRYH